MDDAEYLALAISRRMGWSLMTQTNVLAYWEGLPQEDKDFWFVQVMLLEQEDSWVGKLRRFHLFNDLRHEMAHKNFEIL